MTGQKGTRKKGRRNAEDERRTARQGETWHKKKKETGGGEGGKMKGRREKGWHGNTGVR